MTKNRPNRKIIIVAIVCFSFLFIYSAYGFNLPRWFPFNQRNALNEWQEKVFKDKVFYAIEPVRQGGYLSAKSNQACSGLIYKIRFDVKKYPMISWKWKVSQFPKKGIVQGKESGWVEKDDYAARLYVIFPSWNFMNIRTLEYVWDESLPVNKIMTSPYSKNIKLIVAETGRKPADQWVSEERNIYEDYKKAFNPVNSLTAGALAIMTDSDNTLSTAEAMYKDLKVGYKNEKTK